MNKKTINIILVDDHPLVLEGISAFLDELHSYKINVAGKAAHGEEALELLRTTDDKKIDLILLDLEMPKMDGLLAAKKISLQYPRIKVVIISSYVNEAFVSEALNVDAAGYLVKGASKNEILSAIVKIYEGEKYYSSKIVDVLRVLATKANEKKPLFTKREREVLALIGKDYRTKEIAEELHIAETTVNTHKNNLRDKIGVKSAVGLAKYAVENGYVK